MFNGEKIKIIAKKNCRTWDGLQYNHIIIPNKKTVPTAVVLMGCIWITYIENRNDKKGTIAIIIKIIILKRGPGIRAVNHKIKTTAEKSRAYAAINA